MIKYLIDAQGKYLGCYVDTPAPDGAIEVSTAPANASDVWAAGAWHAATPTPEQEREAFKAARAAIVAAIMVEVDGMPFDGDEQSQTRMARAILALQSAGETSTTWVLSNNTPAEVTLDQLQRALVAAGQAQTAVWVAPVQD